ncbi:MAG: helix-turn-helix domain-containing protein [Methyloligellaceae bacterium]
MQRGNEPPERSDDDLAVIFCEMRRAVQLTREQLAERLLTDVETVAALEDGVVQQLPDPGETSRVVATYTNLLGLDARPILRRIEARRATLGEAEPPPPPPPSQPEPAFDPLPPALAESSDVLFDDADYDADDLTDQYVEPVEKPPRFNIGRLVRRLVLLAVLGGIGFGVWQMAQQPQLFWTTVNVLPEPIPRYVRSAWDLVRPLEKEAPRAIPTGDPRSRKSDRLPIGSSPSGN